jgi:hypothetical protein
MGGHLVVDEAELEKWMKMRGRGRRVVEGDKCPRDRYEILDGSRTSQRGKRGYIARGEPSKARG